MPTAARLRPGGRCVATDVPRETCRHGMTACPWHATVSRETGPGSRTPSARPGANGAAENQFPLCAHRRRGIRQPRPPRPSALSTPRSDGINASRHPQRLSTGRRVTRETPCETACAPVDNSVGYAKPALRRSETHHPQSCRDNNCRTHAPSFRRQIPAEHCVEARPMQRIPEKIDRRLSMRCPPEPGKDMASQLR
jgi:hypothetical protein